MAAAYATSGSGKYKNEILWLTWGGGTNGTSGKAITNGNTTSARIPVTSSTDLQVSCSISDIQSPSGIKSYRPGDWSGDTMDDAYYIGGTGKSNQLIAGIMGSGGPHSFKVTCTSALLTGAASQPVNLRGFVIADAESMAPGEYILGASQGKWSVIERMGSNTSPYYVDKREPTVAAQKIGAAGDSYIKMATKESDGGRGLVTFLQFNQQNAQQSMAFQIKGNGNTAIAIGLLVPFADFGDAPASYNPAMHLIADINFSNDGIGSSGEVNALSSTLPAVNLNPPRTIYLGSTGPDSEPSTPFSADAKGDDNGGQSSLPGSAFYGKEEDAWPRDKIISVLNAGDSLSVIMACNAGSAGRAYVTGWIDFDQDKSFSTGILKQEMASGECRDDRVELRWDLPKTLVVGKTMVRLRIASNATQIEVPDGVADDGEVEDHQIEILGPKLQVTKTAIPDDRPWSAYSGGPYSYRLNVTNIGAVETWTKDEADKVVGGSPWVPIKLEDELPVGVEPIGLTTADSIIGDWTCKLSQAYAQTVKAKVSCTYDVYKNIEPTKAASPLTLPVKLHPNIHQSTSLINTVKVYGSLDPFKETDPCDSVHCSNARVTVERPEVAVSKTSRPIPGPSAKSGDFIEYTLKVGIKGPLSNGKVTLNDFLGEGLEYDSTFTQVEKPVVNWVYTAAASNQSLIPHSFVLPAEITMAPQPIVTLDVWRTYTVTYRAKVLDSAGTLVNNRVSVSTNPTTDPGFEPVISCTSCVTDDPVVLPAVTVKKDAGPVTASVVKAGDVISYTLTVTVSQAKTRDAVVLTDTLATGLEFGAVTANPSGFVLGGSGATHTFTLPADKEPGTYTVTYTAVVKANATSTTIQNIVVPTWQTTPSNNNPPNIGSVGCDPSATCATTHTLTPPDVSVVKSTTAVKARVGDEIDYEVVVTVTGSATTAPVVLQDTLGAGLTYKPGSASGALTVTSQTPLQFTLSEGALPGTYRVMYRATVTSATGAAYTNTIAFTPTGNGGDSTPTCTSCSTSVDPTDSVVKFSKKVNKPGPVKVGDVLTYTVEIEVRDAQTIADLRLRDTLKVGLEYVNPTPGAVIKSSNLPNYTVTSVSNVGGGASSLEVHIPAPIGPTGAQTLVTYQLVYDVMVTSEAAQWVENNVVVDYDPATTTPPGPSVPSCANSCATKTPVADPVVKISKKSTTAAPVMVGQLIDYVVAVKVENAALVGSLSQAVDNVGNGLVLEPGALVMPSGPYVLATLVNSTLQIDLKPNTPPGTYEVHYQAKVTADAVGMVSNQVVGSPTTGGVTPICDGLCKVDIAVKRTIDANDDDYTATSVTGSVGAGYLGNAYNNDTLNGQPVTLQSITGKVDKVELCTSVTTSPVSGCRSVGTLVPQMDAATGVVSVPAGTPQGEYLISYTICDKLDPQFCDSAVVKIKVGASITAKDDGTYYPTRGSGKELVVGNAFDNDTLDTLAFTPDKVTTTVQPYDPAGRVPGLNTVTGQILVPPATPEGEYKIPYTICDKLNPSNCATATITVVVKGDASLLRVVKTAAVRIAKVGDLVRYNLTVENVGTTDVSHASLVDTPAAGMTYVAGSLQTMGLGSNVSAQGVRPVAFDGVSLAAGQTGAISYLARVGAGVQQGTLVNKALVRNGAGDTISNVATASVQVNDDPLLDHSLIFGTVFDDRDGDGWQDSATVTGLKIQGGFAPGAYVAGSTTMDRGDGPQAVADASAPLLHGLTVGDIAARESEADPVRKHQVVIRQKLSSLDFTDDLVLTSEQGVSVRMNAQGQTRMEQQGEAAAGRNAVQLDVQRHVTPTEDGYWVDYVLRSTGVDERGIPGVRIASVEGVLIETDQFGRFHLVDVHGGAWERGRNFVLKLDPSTLPEGASLTTSNPLLRRITPGLPVRFDFGVKLQPAHLVGGMQWVELELGTVLFAPGQAQLQTQYLPVIAKVADKLAHYRGGELLVQADGEYQALALARAQAVHQAVVLHLPPEVAQQTRVSVRTLVDQQGGIVSGVTAQGLVLGTVLFDTDKAVVRPAYRALLAEVARMLNQQGGGVLHITGHTDVRASYIYNQKLGMQRAHAVYEALLPHLSDAVKARVRVEPPIGAERDVTRRQAQPVPGVPEVNPVPSN